MLKLGHLARPRRFTTHGAFVIISDIASSPDEDKEKQSCGSQEAPQMFGLLSLDL